MLSRSAFVRAAGGAALVTAARARAIARPALLAPVKPPRLRTGDSVGLVSPAGPLASAEELHTGIKQIELLGLRPVVGKHAMDRWNYLAGSDEARAEDFNAFLRDPQIRGIFALRGGYGTMRILDALDYAAFSHDPKIVFGFSDLTALLNALHLRTNVVVFHGPVAAASTYTPAVVQNIVAATMRARPIGTLRNQTTATVVPGVARGRLAGGNLTLVSGLSGTPYAVRTEGNILFLEDVHEEPYRIDQMLTTLALDGSLRNAAGIAGGAFTEPDRKASDGPSQELVQTLQDRFAQAARPAVRGMQFGHILNQWVMPIGALATLDATAGTLTIEEAAVA